ncbi:hypothetical protein BV22DRAFT_1029843 [Leucogyrophana mollusca]|uniref:Uncharacterized protein n=1 Tax=Leucogyrophana mollusca TaxID=85980 RepID=A0ACB8BUY0_9AGAM|nr:hypothetical protein BV22DRAFT_1029843 [Leucogyrophana mollusca]
MSSGSSLRRSSRGLNKKPVSYVHSHVGYPDTAPTSDVEKFVARLDKEAFKVDQYAAVDDAIVFALFSKKVRPTYYNALHPAPSSHVSMPTAEEGIKIIKACDELINRDHPTFQACQMASLALIERFGSIFSTSDKAIIRHLLSRYMLLHSADSLVGLDKISLDGETVTGGIKARKDIPASTFLLTLSGSMSKNTVTEMNHSIIQASASQMGPGGNRMILGPFRFVNHDCKPNCQIYPVPNTHAAMFVTLRDIAAGEPITAAYTRSGYYMDDCHCLCASCNPDRPPRRLTKGGEPAVSNVSAEVVGARKKRHRGGKRQQRANAVKRRRLEECNGVSALCANEVEERLTST